MGLGGIPYTEEFKVFLPHLSLVDRDSPSYKRITHIEIWTTILPPTPNPTSPIYILSFNVGTRVVRSVTSVKIPLSGGSYRSL